MPGHSRLPLVSRPNNGCLPKKWGGLYKIAPRTVLSRPFRPDFLGRKGRSMSSSSGARSAETPFEPLHEEMAIPRWIEMSYDRAVYEPAPRERPKRKPMKTICRQCAAVLVLLLLSAVLHAPAARADDIQVVTSGGFTAAYLELVPDIRRRHPQ